MTVPHEGFDGESTATLALSRPAQRCLHVFPSSPRSRCRIAARCASFAAANRGPCAPGTVRRVVSRAVRRLALTSLADSAAHRGVAWPDRGAREPSSRGSREDRRNRGAFERLGAGARAARSPGPGRRAAGRAQPAAGRRVALAALAACARAAVRAAADRRPGARHPPRRCRPHPRRRARFRRQGLRCRRRRRRRPVVLQAGGVRDPRRHGALDRRAAAGAAAGTHRGRRGGAQRPALARHPRRCHPACGLGRSLHDPRPVLAAAVLARRRLASLERQHVQRPAACRRARAAPLRHATVRAERGRRRLARLVRGARRPARGGDCRHLVARGHAPPRQERRGARIRAGRGPLRCPTQGRPHRRRGPRLRLRHRRRHPLAEGRPERRLGAAGRRGRDQRRVLGRAARHRRDGRHRRPRAARRGAAHAPRRRPSRGRDHPAQHPLGRADRRAGALPGEGQAERPVAHRPRRRAARRGRPAGAAQCDGAARCERGRRRGADRPGAGRGRVAGRFRRAGAALRPARRQAGLEDRAASRRPAERHGAGA